MRRHPIYLLYGLSILSLAGYAEYAGWGFGSSDEATGIPKSIRDNPGAYRSVYRNYDRYMGGK